MVTDAAPSEPTAADYRALLEHEREDLHRQLAELGFGGAEGLHYDPNFADSSQVTAERGEAEALAGQLRDALAQVEQAIQRLVDGSYGICEVCGQPIASARLEAKPTARRCINCASRP
jgi:DnaK suppressor protein